ncbi:MAG: YcxB family protein [Eubacteriales bacterium]|nr:YcxB family protein [Eubacteriales bacterium]
MNYEVKTVLTKRLIRESYRRMAVRTRLLSILYILVSLAYIGIAWYLHTTDRWLQTVIGLVGAVIGLVLLSGIWRWQAGRDVRLLATEQDVTIKLLFIQRDKADILDREGRGICVYRPFIEGKLCYRYRDIKRILEMKHGFILVLRGGGFLIAEKAGFVNGDPHEFVSWLKLQRRQDR